MNDNNKMWIVDAVWTSKVNRLKIRCSCGKIIIHPANRWRVVCDCGRTDNLANIRERPFGNLEK